MIAAVDPVAVIGLGWTIGSAVVGGIVSGLVMTFLLGTKFGSYSGRLDAVEKAADAAARAEEVRAELSTVKADLAKAARLEHVNEKIAAEREVRERMERDLMAVKARLEAGDKRFDQLVRVGQIAENLTDELKATQAWMAKLDAKIPGLVTHSELEKDQAAQQRFCDQRHSGKPGG